MDLNVYIHLHYLIFRLLEGRLSVMHQSSPGPGELQKWRQPGGEVPPQVQAASQPGASL